MTLLFCPKQTLNNVIRGIDAVDNGQKGMIDNLGTSLSDVVRVYNTPWNKESKDGGMTEFMETLSVVQMIFEKELERIESNMLALQIIKDTYERAEDKRIIVFDRYVPAKEYFADNTEDVAFVIFPSNRGGYNVVAVPPDMEHAMEQRFPIRADGKELVEGISFIHKNMFMAVADTVENAVRLARLSIEKC